MRALLWISLLSALACHRPSQREAKTVGVIGASSYESSLYQNLDHWLCNPQKKNDACHQDLRATEILPDGTRKIVEHTSAADPAVDCFYIYPTVDLHLKPGNHTNFDDIAKMEDTAMAQAARFTEACAVYAPLYRQVSIGTYRDREANQRYFDVAYSDVVDAFRYYMSHDNKGRKVILIGHSQGAQVLIRLLQELFDNDPELRAKLIVAMPIGFDAEVAQGDAAGGSFKNLPECRSAEELGCVIAYRSYAANVPLSEDFTSPKPGNELACVAPNGASDTPRPLSRTYLPTERVDGYRKLKIETPFVLMRDFYSGRCVKRTDGKTYLEISQTNAPGDKRWSLIDLTKYDSALGLHIFDMQLPQGDLIDLAKKKIAVALAPN